MTVSLNPYLSFDGNAREAMETYQGIFGGDLSLSTFAEFGSPDAPHADKIMHGSLEAPGGLSLMAADNPPHMKHEPGNNFAVSLSADAASAGDLRTYWDRLVDGGQVTMPLEKQVWGDEFGMCVDRFGIAWMVNIGQPQA